MHILYIHYNLVLQVHVHCTCSGICKEFRVGGRESITSSQSTAQFRHAFSETSATRGKPDYENQLLRQSESQTKRNKMKVMHKLLGRRPRGTGGTVLPKNLRWRDGPWIRDPYPQYLEK